MLRSDIDSSVITCIVLERGPQLMFVRNGMLDMYICSRLHICTRTYECPYFIRSLHDGATLQHALCEITVGGVIT